MTTFNDLFNMPAIEDNDTLISTIFYQHLSSFPEIAYHPVVENSLSQNLTDECMKILNEDSRIKLSVLINNKYVNGCHEKYGKKVVAVFFDQKPLLVGLFSGRNQSLFSCSIVNKQLYDNFVAHVLNVQLRTIPEDELEYLNINEKFVQPDDLADEFLEYAKTLH